VVVTTREKVGGPRDLIWLLGALLLPLPWLFAAFQGGAGLSHELTASLAGVAIVGAAFLLSWAVELAERDIPQSLAILVLALISVLPEYAVDLHFAIRAASDPSYAHYAVANMTGANRLLIGVGWAAVVLLACWRNRTKHLVIPGHQRLEMRFLLLSTLYSFLIPLNGEIDLFDAAVLFGLFGWYVAAAAKGHREESELVGPAAWLECRVGDRARRLIVLALLVYSAGAIFLSAEPFAEGLVHIGTNYDIDEFLLVQWVAPLASESPEFVIALLFAWRHRGALGLGALISSKVNQWTLLVGALPVAYAIASGAFVGLPLDDRQTEELLLTSAQSLLATLLICDLDFSRLEAVLLAAAFGVQLFFPDTEVRIAFSFLYLVIFVLLLLYSPERRQGFFSLLKPKR
jgi:cation:H+ antiporter